MMADVEELKKKLYKEFKKELVKLTRINKRIIKLEKEQRKLREVAQDWIKNMNIITDRITKLEEEEVK